MNETEQRIDALFDRLVPDSGKADTVAGEIVRAICRIRYRCRNDGDHLGIWCGEEEVNSAARYLAAKCDSRVNSALAAAWGIDNDDAYSKKLEAVEEAVLAYLDAHPELETEANSEDMWDYQGKDEDGALGDGDDGCWYW